MSNTRHVASRRKGRHRPATPAITQRLAAPGRAGAVLLTVGAFGVAGTAGLVLSAGSASAGTRPPVVNGGSLTIGQQNGQTTAGVRLNTPFGTTPLLSLPSAAAPPAPQPSFPVTVDPAAIANDPAYQGLIRALTPAASTPAITVPQLPDVTFNPPPPAFVPAQPVPFVNLPDGIPGLLPAAAAASAPATAPAPAVDTSAPTVPELPPPTGSVTGSVSGALGPIGGTAGLTVDNQGNAALTLGYLVGMGGSARFFASPNPAPTTLGVDAGAQASGSLFGLGLTGGVSGSLTNFNGLQVFGRATSPAGNQFTATGTVPPSVLQNIGQADSDAAAAEAGLLAAPPPPAPTPNQQVAQGFADLAGSGGDGGGGFTIAPGGRLLSFGAQTTAGVTVTIPITRDYLNQVGQALGNADMMAPEPAAASLTPAERIDQGFSAVNSTDPASIVQQDFQALGAPATTTPATTAPATSAPAATTPDTTAPASQAPDPATVIQQDFQDLGTPAITTPATATPDSIAPTTGGTADASPPVVSVPDPTTVSDPAPVTSTPPPVSAGPSDIGPVASTGGGFSGGGSG
jgi:hypothetical protein